MDWFDKEAWQLGAAWANNQDGVDNLAVFFSYSFHDKDGKAIKICQVEENIRLIWYVRLKHSLGIYMSGYLHINEND